MIITIIAKRNGHTVDVANIDSIWCSNRYDGRGFYDSAALHNGETLWLKGRYGEYNPIETYADFMNLDAYKRGETYYDTWDECLNEAVDAWGGDEDEPEPTMESIKALYGENSEYIGEACGGELVIKVSEEEDE